MSEMFGNTAVETPVKFHNDKITVNLYHVASAFPEMWWDALKLVKYKH